MTACSASGTARGRASTAPATCSATPTTPAPRRHGGVLALMGDDHTCESSTTAHQSEFHFVDVMIPVLNPAGRAGDHRLRPLRLGAVALRRHLGRPQGGEGHHRVHRHRGRTAGPRGASSRRLPASTMPPGGLNIRLGDTRAGAGGAASGVSSATRCMHFLQGQPPQPLHHLRRRPPAHRHRHRGQVATSTCASRWTSWASTRCAPTIWGIRIWKVACPWPLETQGLLRVRQAASTSSWWWRRSAPSLRCRCARSCTAPPTSPSASARRTSRAAGCSR